MIVKKQRIVFWYILLEFILLNLCIGVILYLKNTLLMTYEFSRGLENDYLPFLFILNFAWGLIVLYNGTQDLYVSSSLKKRVKYIILNSLIFLGLVSVLVVAFKINFFNRTALLGPIFGFACLNLCMFVIVHFLYRKKSKNSPFGSKILVLGAGEKGKEVLQFTEKNRHLGYGVVGFLEDEINYPTYAGVNVLGKIKDLPSVLDSQLIDEIVITLPARQEEEIKQAIAVADYRGVRVNLVQETPGWMGKNFKSYKLDELPVYELRRTPLDSFNNFLFKKSFDMIFSSMVLVLLSPVFLIIAMLVKLTSKGPVLYTPLRKGEAGYNFKCYKFRTMYVSEDPNAGTKSTVKNDPRITKIGKYLRKMDLDELPQFFNVLKGDMSVVGPRPHRVNLNEDFRKIVNDYMVRHYVKPGISGWAQVNGWRGPTETLEQKKERVNHDLWYIENWSFWVDIKIVFLTVFGKKTRKNAF